jgi:hypothetical protein
MYTSALPAPHPAFRRVMAFADGENLARRYEDTLKAGAKPRPDGIVHVPGSLIWHPTFTWAAHIGLHEILRTTYYTSMVGSPQQLDSLRDQIKGLTFQQGRWSELPNNVTPEVFQRDKGTQRSKGVDITLVVDALTQAHSNAVDTILLLSGDGDYLPLLREIRRSGKQVYLSAFESGLNAKLRHEADHVYILDNTAFIP